MWINQITHIYKITILNKDKDFLLLMDICRNFKIFADKIDLIFPLSVFL